MTSIPWPLALALLCLAPSAVAQEAGAWLPLEVGSSATYRTHRDTTLRQPGERTVRRFHRGRTSERFEADEGARVRLVRRHAEGAMDAPGVAPVVERERLVFSRQGDGVRLHAVAPLDSGSEIERVSYERPIQMLPTRVRVGAEWAVGALRSGDLTADLRGSIVGREDLDLDGTRYTGALHVRYQGPLRGDAELELPNGPAEIQRGTYTRDSWLVRGIGIVREITEFQIEARYRKAANDEAESPGPGPVVTLQSRETRRLEQHEPAP